MIMGALLTYTSLCGGQSWWAKRAVASEQRLIERAIRKNGMSWLAEFDHSRTFTTVPLQVIGQALRAHFSAVLQEPIPMRFLDLLQRLDLGTPPVKAALRG